MLGPETDDLGLSPEFADPANYDPMYDRYEPTGQCAICEEPFERGYTCGHCGADLCPGCVCGTLDQPISKLALCPGCPGAVYVWEP